MSELKPCPFCGGKAEVSAYRDHCMPQDPLDYNPMQVGWSPTQWYCVFCSECHARVDDAYKMIEDAIKAWNRRQKC